MASSRNCQTISLRRAPIALRTPISRVRSVTETSMMFITPMPPTSRPIDETTTITRPTVAMIWRNWLIRTFGAGDAEVVGIGGLDVPAAAQQFGHFVLGLIHFAGLERARR